ncbi:transglutaminase domain-containing protein [uncultured Aquimarina sp.]|uniref:transglutaminase-like domain-containing protein n=1 Tax=uncultured Aquimarina sp. TaxID=575652 RepID=UPI0026288D9E|nr:transglutaminase domain-containing protein [uncultured Aquimarina sp.]
MQTSFIKLILLATYLFFSTQGVAQDIAIKTRSERVLIHKDSSFTKTVTILLKKSEETITYPIFYDTELERITDIKVYKKKGKRFKLVKNTIINEEDVELDYIASKKIKSITLPYQSETKIVYTIECKELMYFSDLHFFSYNEIDSLKYQISVPNTFRFIHNTIHKDSLKHITIDSIRSDNHTKWNIEVVPVKVKPDPLLFFRVYKNIREPLMRTLIIPKTYEGNERKYLNDWYLQKVETKKGLNYAAIRKIDELTKGISDPMKVMNILYSYVHNNFKYVAIEIGMGAFIPTHANEVFTNKQGDCKDLSNFLSEALNYKGIKSHVALAATFDHISDCDFPSLSSANHVICLAYIDGKPILLDPTDPIHLSETPVQSIQQRSILIINTDGGEFYKVPSFSPKQNVISYNIDLEANSNTMAMDGEFKVNYGGISGNFLKYGFMYSSDREANKLAQKHYESVFGNQSISDLKMNHQSRVVESEGKISANGKIFKDGDKQFFFIDFLPKLFETEDRETLLEGTHIGSPFSKKVSSTIKMSEPFQAFNPIEHSFSFEGASLSIKISNPSEFTIECSYEFVFDYIFVEKENLEIANKLLTSFKKIINDPIILQKKS